MFKDGRDITEISRDDVEERIPGVLKLFEKKRKDDPSGNAFSNDFITVSKLIRE